ncbi:cell adhesion molecule DSCAM [Ictalurus punctatus]|uniref:Cell adhesion molecule DSCAM n=1 Tax=Ictalurus punctatus TaxID=7998 RepID=A0A9F7TR86_ICTPU|nr:cell adhesion molecule DSCAM [Ictalurus punctatus]
MLIMVCFYLLLLLHITAGCRLEGNGETKPITAYTGGSVLLPCSCTDLHTKPETLTWRKITNDWVEISPEREQFKDRFQLVNDLSSGNLSLLISHLTEEDGGDYMCRLTKSQNRYFRLTVKGCTVNHQTVTVTGYVGQSVLLPCSCSELQAKPHTFRWEFLEDHKEIFPKGETNRYTDRVQIFNDHLPVNLSLLISHLTVEDGGWYRCKISNTDFKDILVTVKDAPTRPSASRPVITTTSPNTEPERLPFVPFAVVTVIFLHIIVAVVYCRTRKKVYSPGPDRVHYSRADGDGAVSLQWRRTRSADPSIH